MQLNPVQGLNPRVAYDNYTNKIKQLAKEIVEVESSHRKIVVHSVEIPDTAKPFDLNGQQKTREEGGTWSCPVRVTASLQTRDGKTISRAKVTLGKVPVVTRRLTYLVGGREYQIANQFRRMSGVYTRVADSGEIEAVAASERRGQLRIKFNQQSGEISIQPIRGSGSMLSMYTLLNAAGRSDEEIARAWGKELVEQNKMLRTDAQRRRAVLSIAQRMDKSAQVTSPQQAARIIFAALAEHTLDPRVTNDILGRPHQTLTPETLLDTGSQLVGISKGTHKPSTYNNIGHKKMLGPGEIIYDYMMRRDKEIRQRIKNRMGSDSKDIKRVLTNVLDRNINAFFKQGGETRLVSEASQINPLATISGHLMTTVKGEGGISTGPGMQLGDAVMPHSSHIGVLDPIDTGEKSDTGLILPMGIATSKKGDRVATHVYNVKTGKIELVDALELNKAIVAYPDDIEFDSKTGKVRATKAKVRAVGSGGGTIKVPLSKCEYAYIAPHTQFGIATNLVPFLNNNNGNRVMMAAKMAQQSVSLTNREAPLVQIASTTDKRTMEGLIGDVTAEISPVDGVVTAVTSSAITIKADGGKTVKVALYDKFPTNDPKTMLNSEPLVKVGDRVKRKQTLADNNFTKGGTLALGTNLRVGYLPMRGYNYEDGVVISRSASKKLTSGHLSTVERDTSVAIGTRITPKIADKQEDGAVIINKPFFAAFCPRSVAQYRNFNALEDTGIVKKGTVLEHGDIIIAACRKVDNDPARRSFMKSLKIKSSWTGAEISWEKESPGKVIKVLVTRKAVKVYIETEEPMKLGDKLVGRYGNKGVVTKILEDHEMPFYTDAKGERQHVEVGLHPAGVPGRINPGQLLEMGAAKIAEKRGKPYVVKNFDNRSKDRLRELLAEMKKEGVTDQEKLKDPSTGKEIGSVIVGPQYIQKLTHQVDKKMTMRSAGTMPGLASAKYDNNNQPTSGTPNGGQAMGALGLYSLLGHNARAMLSDLQTHHSTYEVAERPGQYDSDDYWNALSSGLPLPSAKETFATKKFFSFIKGMGVEPRKNADEYQLVPMTDSDILKQCPHEVKKPNRMIKGKTGEVEDGGLFAFPQGERNSDKWGHIKLTQRILNPVFEKPAAHLLGIPVGKFGDVLSGKTEINGHLGMASVVAALRGLNVTKEIKDAEKRLETARKQERDSLYKKLKCLKALKRLKLEAGDAYTMKYMPVLPPRMRPIGMSQAVGKQGDIDTKDINQHYKNVGMVNSLLKAMPKEALPEKKMGAAFSLYSKVKEAYLEGALDNKGQPMNSLLQSAVQPMDQSGGHKQGKTGFFQSKLIKRRSELSGRSVITPEPSLSLDQVGVPRKMALAMYRPFVIRHLRTAGYSTLAAAKKLREEPKSPAVRAALDAAVKDRPCLMKRDPALHKHNVLSFYPKIIEGKAIEIHPLVCGGFNADFDGDTMALWVPSSDKAREEAKNMLPSKNLFGVKNFGLMNKPEQGSAYGIWQLTERGKKTNKSFSSAAEPYALHKKGKLDISDVIKVAGKETTVGRLMLHDKLPSKLKSGEIGNAVLYGDELTKSAVGKLLGRIARLAEEDYPRLADDWKDLGNKYAHEKAWSFGLEDFKSHGDIRDKYLKIADAKLAKIKNPKDSDKIKVYREAATKIEKELTERLKKNPNRLWRMTKQSGAMGSKWNQTVQMVSSPLQVMDAEGNVVPDPVRRSYSEGMKISDYWDSIPGVRAGTLSRVKGTSEPGAAAKSLVNLNINLVVRNEDCGTRTGVPINTSDQDLESRYLVGEVKAGSRVYKRNTLVTPEVVADLRKHHKSVQVRSPVTCANNEGVCKKCSGVNERGKEYDIGENVGIASAQSLSEPLTQMAMNAFHTGGSASGAGAEIGDEFDHLSKLFLVPKQLKGAATISEADDKVVRIEPDKIAGGFRVVTADRTYRVPADKKLLVKVGDKLKAGQPLSSGKINPHELLEAAGMGAVRAHMIQEMHRVYGRHGVRRRYVETLVRNLTSIVEVISDGEHEYEPKERLTRNQTSRINKERRETGKKEVRTRPILIDINRAVMAQTEGDFLAQLNFQHVRKALQEGMVYGAKSKLHGYNPLPGLAVGTEFGKGKEGRY